MTDYAAMTDREIDALVAERVMGWTGIHVEEIPKCGVKLLVGLDPERNIVDAIWNYSTNANSALEVAKEFERRHPNENVLLNTDGGDGWHAHASVFLRNGDAWNASPARAICEAILQATEPE